MLFVLFDYFLAEENFRCVIFALKKIQHDFKEETLISEKIS